MKYDRELRTFLLEELILESARLDDVQGEVRVSVVYPNGTEQLLPERFWRQYYEKHGVYHCPQFFRA